ncbi:hypothetical protein [Deinococcus peraridilitoris]|uniref:Uncharacterized protein n=1 Tax=Deinococcus peraridilitoris (strain DSM 19664 / LMG 22246 / CIP 109416 / KR-200) TaxID=937777 RepID=L0A5P5_DEIPD|nr:hypothetical protein [Deinococcus peraridilitoris]AFZ69166.1 hypothetical protein Deipe_3740 [Deinococcus peraridilitoris DSM 19664]
MRWAWIVLIVAVATLAYFAGLRFGYLSLTPTWMYNAQGNNSYTFRTYDERGEVFLSGSCTTRSGEATLRLYAPGGTFVGGQVCRAGSYNLALRGGGEIGLYKLTVDFNHFTGRLEINENRSASY